MDGDENSDGGISNDFDMDGALGSIAEGLGFGPDEAEDLPDDAPDPGLGDPKAAAGDAGAPAPVPAGTPAPASTTPPVGAPPADPAAPTAIAPPRTWRPEAAATWGQIPPAAQAEIAKREDDMFKGLEAYKADAGLGKGLKQAIGKYIPTFQQYNIDPMQQISGLMDAHFTLATGTPEAKVAMFQQIAKDYGVDLVNAAVAQSPYVDPQVERLQKELDSVKSTLTAEQSRKQQEARQAFEADVAKFATAPENSYFEELSQDMAELLEKGMAKDLREAYDKALRLNPIVFAKEQARTQAETAKKAAEEAARKAAAARKATSANVRSSAKAGSAATPLGSIDDTLQSAYREIMSRG